jgi:amino acid permease
MEQQHQQNSLLSAEGALQLSVPTRNDESVTTHSVETAQPPEEGFDEDLDIPREKSNQDDPVRRAREFRARHIQMMALGISPMPQFH